MQEVSAFLNNMDWSGLISLLLRVAAVLLCIMIHEISHGLAACWLGDPTAKAMKRLSLNPLRHIDPFGALMMLVAGFGWAKPVPVDVRYFKKPKAGMAITALAGPISNFLLSYICFLAAYFLLGILAVTSAAVTESVLGLIDFLTLMASLSIGLGVFNLIPFPPLDGSKVLGMFLPDRIYYKIMRYEFVGTLVLMALLWSGILDSPLFAVRNWITEGLLYLAQWPYQLLV